MGASGPGRPRQIPGQSPSAESTDTWRSISIVASPITRRGLVAGFDDVMRLGSRWPEVTVSTSYGTPALKVRGKTFCRMWGPRDVSKADVGAGDVLVVFCELDEKQFLLAESDRLGLHGAPLRRLWCGARPARRCRRGASPRAAAGQLSAEGSSTIRRQFPEP